MTTPVRHSIAAVGHPPKPPQLVVDKRDNGDVEGSIDRGLIEHRAAAALAGGTVGSGASKHAATVR